SPVAHGQITNVDVAEARALEGVVAVFTSEDVGGLNGHGLYRGDQPVLAGDRVRYKGDAVALVVATSDQLAAAAAEKVQVAFEALPIVATMDEAMAEGAYPLYPEGNVLGRGVIRTGDADRAFADEAEVVIEHEVLTQGVDHAFLDLEAGYAEMQGDVVAIYAAGQWLHEERRIISLALGVPVERIRLVQPPTGGAFGGREDISIQIVLGLAAMKLGKRVRIQYTRPESMIARHKRHAMRIRYTLGAKRDGTLVAAKVKIDSDEGAYTSTGPFVLRKAVSHSTGPYRVPHVTCEAVSIFTNNNPTGAMRGFGATQMAISYEGAMTKLARTLGMDPIALRRKNLLHEGERVTTTQMLNVASGEECLDAALAQFGDWDKRSYQTISPRYKRGYGVSVICFGIGYGDGFPDTSRARVRFDDEGVLEVYTGAVDMGQGVHSMVAQIAGSELGVDPTDVRVIASDTQTTPDAGSSSATRQTVYTGNAVKIAAAELAWEVKDIALAYTGKTWHNLELRGGKVRCVGDNTLVMPLSQVVRLGRERGFDLDQRGIYRTNTSPKNEATGHSPRAFVTYTFGAQIAEVLVDVETGEVKVERIIAAHDVGKAINPQQVEGQIEGGVAQGIGMALMEEVITHRGEIVNASFTDYIIPTFVDVPRIEAVIVEHEDPAGPYGARGIGEPPLIGAVPAILGAIGDALDLDVTEMPATAERVWRWTRDTEEMPRPRRLRRPTGAA
ncbi:MAG: xanthine dehydrogenase family protein, partial [Deltaproteobacteria bacterium]|nr:xanthine dehydrogenase family protein [Deltaproteobacteria bacterium]